MHVVYNIFKKMSQRPEKNAPNQNEKWCLHNIYRLNGEFVNV